MAITIVDIQQINNRQLPKEGQVFVGLIGDDPLVNPIIVYSDQAETQAIQTPITLDLNGRPLDPATGDVINLYTDASYSIQWLDKDGNPLLPEAVEFEEVELITDGAGTKALFDDGLYKTLSAGGVSSVNSGASITVDNTAPATPIVNMSDMAQNTIKGRITASTGAPEDLSSAQVITMLSLGDVVSGPASAIVNNFFGFDGATGKLAKDSLENALTLRGKAIKIVNEEVDLPAASGGFHTLAAGVRYIQSGALTLSNGIRKSAGSSYGGSSPISDTLTYTGSGVLFDATDVDMAFSNLRIILTGAATLWDFEDSTGTKFNTVENCLVIATAPGATIGNVGAATNGSTVTSGSCLYTGFDNPLGFDGTLTRFSYDRCFFSNNDDVFSLAATLNLTTSDINNCTFSTDDVGDKVLTDAGATISTQVTVANCTLSGPGSFDTNLELNPDYILRNNTGFKNTQLTVQGSIKGSAATTGFGGIGIANSAPVNFGGLLIPADEKQFTIDVNGLITYIGKEERQFYFDITIFAVIAGGSSRDYFYFWHKNRGITGDLKIVSSENQAQYNGSNPGSSSCKTVIELKFGDTMEIAAYQLAGSIIPLNVITASPSGVSV